MALWSELMHHICGVNIAKIIHNKKKTFFHNQFQKEI